MKVTRGEDFLEDFLSRSERVIREKSSTSDESLFSRLLELESRLRVGTKGLANFRIGQRESSTMNGQPLASSTLSRYIE
jgi:hypothetical protein